MKRAVLRPMLAVAVLLEAACTGKGHSAPSPVVSTSPPIEAVRSPCEDAATERGRVSSLLAEGRIHRITRVVARADHLCPATWRDSAAALLSALVELGRYAEARALAQRIAADPGADARLRAAAEDAQHRADLRARTFDDPVAAQASMRALEARANEAAARGDHSVEKELYLQAWEAYHPGGRALLGAAEAASALGNRAEAQRLFDRAIADLERSEASSFTIDDPVTTDGTFQMGPTGSEVMAIYRDAQALLIDTRSFQPKRLLPDAVAASEYPKFVLGGAALAMVRMSHDQEPTTIRLWDVDSGRLVRSFSLASSEMPPEFSPDGSRLALPLVIGSNQAGIWDLTSGKRLPPLLRKISKTSFSNYEFSHDGKLVAETSPSDKEIRIYHVDTGTLERRLLGDVYPNGVFFTAEGSVVSRSGEFLAVNDEALASRERFDVWDVKSGRRLTAGGVQDVCGPWPRFSHYADHGSSPLRSSAACKEHWVKYKRLESDAPRAPGGSPGWKARSFSDDLELVAIAEAPGILRILDVATERTLRTIDVADRSRLGSAVVFSPDRRRIIVDLVDGCGVWDITSGQLVARFFFPVESAVTAVAFRPDGEALMAASEDGGAQIWDIATSKVEVFAERFDIPPRKRMDLGGYMQDEGREHIWEATGGRLDYRSSGPRKIATLALGTQDFWFDQSHERGFGIYSDADGKALRSLDSSSSKDTHVALRPDGEAVAWTSGAIVKITDLRTGETIRALDEPATALSFRPDGRALATARADGTLRVWDVNSGAAGSPVSAGSPVNVLALGPDGALACVTADGSIHVLDPDHGAPPKHLSGGHGARALAFHPKHAQTLLAGGDAGIVVWHLPETAPVGKLQVAASSHTGYALTAESVETFGDPQQEYRRCRVGRVPLPFAACAERTVVHGSLAHLFTGAPLPRE
jgi:WD40 repeat protein